MARPGFVDPNSALGIALQNQANKSGGSFQGSNENVNSLATFFNLNQAVPAPGSDIAIAYNLYPQTEQAQVIIEPRTVTRSITPSNPVTAVTPSKGISKTSLLIIGAGVALLLGLGYGKHKRK